MNGVHSAADMRDESSAGHDGSAQAGLMASAGALRRELHGMAHDYLLLVALETKRAGQSLAIMIAAGVMIALLLASAWLGLLAAAVLGMLRFGVTPGVAVLLAVATNLFIALLLYGLILRKRRYLEFPATINSLRPESPGPAAGAAAGTGEQP